MKILLLLTSALATSGFSALAAGPTPAAARPNIILLLTDDQGFPDVHRHGHPALKLKAIGFE